MSSNPPLEKTIEGLELDILKEIVAHLKDGSITADDAREYAQFFLDLEPFSDFDDVKKKLHELCDKAPVFKPVYIRALTTIEKIQMEQQLAKMRSYMSTLQK